MGISASYFAKTNAVADLSSPMIDMSHAAMENTTMTPPIINTTLSTFAERVIVASICCSTRRPATCKPSSGPSDSIMSTT